MKSEQYTPPEYVQSILKSRYYQEGEDWTKLCERVSKAGASIEKTKEEQKFWDEKFFYYLSSTKFLPNSPALANAGANHIGCVAACFALRPEDSMSSIMDTATLAAMILKFGGGIGFELSQIRPEGSTIQSTHKQAMGPIGLMKFYQAVGDLVTQSGIRKAALMGLLRIEHPDIVRFIRAKNEDGSLSNFNISVSMTDSWMKKLTKDPDRPHTAHFGGRQYNILSNGTAILRASRGSKKVLSMKNLWKVICESASTNGDPGIFFIDHANKNNPLIDNLGDTENPYYIHGSNPCLVGDQKVHVADGRGMVSIKRLAKEGKDIPVFCLNNNGKLRIRIMRHPRLTGKQRKILKINLSDEGILRCTENHKIRLLNGTYKEAKDLKIGERLEHGITFEAPIEEIITGSNSRSQLYLWDKTSSSQPIANHRFIAGFHQDIKLKPGLVIHHKDRNGLNNHPSNLEIMTRKEHNFLHRDHMLGDNNPMRRFPEKCWLKTQDWSGKNNGRYINISNEDYFQRAVEASSQTERRLSAEEWMKICREEKIPIASKYRLKSLGFKSASKMLKAAAKIANVFSDLGKLKSYRHYLKIKKDYDLPLEFDPNTGTIVTKTCEFCRKEFKAHWTRREACFCSFLCSVKGKKKITSEQLMRAAEGRQREVRANQIGIYLSLEKMLQRTPFRKEWENKCKEENIPWRLRSRGRCNKYCFRTFAEVKKAAANYTNFTVKSIENDGYEDVYNGTVDQFHNFATYVGENKTESGNNQSHWIINRQCGEVGLSNLECCCLASIDLAKFVTGKELDTEGLQEAFETATRMMDNLIDFSHWPDERIKEKVLQTRRIGIGIMGFTSMLDKMEVKYASEECLKLIDIIGTIRETSCSKMSKKLAEERGLYLAAKKGEKHRNVALTTLPPTGTLAMIANTSWSLEPHLYWAFTETRNDEERFRYLPIVEELLEEEKLRDIEEVADGDIKKINEMIQTSLPPHMILAGEISPEDHLKVVSAWQRYTDNAISKTISAPQEILTSEKVGEIFKSAWDNKLKGLTVYPEGSRAGEPMSVGGKAKKNNIVKLPDELDAKTIKVRFDVGGETKKAFMHVGFYPEDPSKPIQIFLTHPHEEDETFIQFISMMTRLVSLCLRYRTCPVCKEESLPIGQIIKQLNETDGQSMFSVPKILVQVLAKYVDKNEPVGSCPKCQGDLVLTGRCSTCISCSWSKCG